MIYRKKNRILSGGIFLSHTLVSSFNFFTKRHTFWINSNICQLHNLTRGAISETKAEDSKTLLVKLFKRTKEKIAIRSMKNELILDQPSAAENNVHEAWNSYAGPPKYSGGQTSIKTVTGLHPKVSHFNYRIERKT